MEHLAPVQIGVLLGVVVGPVQPRGDRHPRPPKVYITLQRRHGRQGAHMATNPIVTETNIHVGITTFSLAFRVLLYIFANVTAVLKCSVTLVGTR